MKKYILYIAACFAALVSCSKVDNVAEEKTYDPNDLEFVFDVDEPSAFDGSTKSTKTSWSEGDKIYIAFDITTESSSLPQNLGEFLILQYTDGAWTVLQKTSKQLNSAGIYDALYMDVEPNITFGSPVRMNVSESKGQFMYMTAKKCTYKVTGNIVSPLSTLTLNPREERFRQFCVTGLSDEPWSISFEVEGKANHYGVEYPDFERTNGVSYYGFNWISDPATNMVPLAKRADGHYIWAIVNCYKSNTVNLTVRLSNATKGTFHKTFSGKKVPSAVSFDGPDNYTSPTNDWVKE